MIEVRGLSKSFGTMKALDDVSFRINRGEILGWAILDRPERSQCHTFRPAGEVRLHRR